MGVKFHTQRLSDFQNYLISQGWTIHPTRGKYEVLRATVPGHPTLIVFKDEKGNFTIPENDIDVMNRFYESINNKANHSETWRGNVGDAIRRLNNEQLAELLMYAENSGYMDASITPKQENGYHIPMLDWLNSPWYPGMKLI